MAKGALKTFHFTIGEEGASKTRRGKFPSGAINELGGKKGELIEVSIQNGRIVDGGIIRGREAAKVRETIHSQSINERPRVGTKKAATMTTASTGKNVIQQAVSKVTRKIVKTTAAPAAKPAVKAAAKKVVKPQVKAQAAPAKPVVSKVKPNGGGLKAAASKIKGTKSKVRFQQPAAKPAIKKVKRVGQ